jgi:hypothetical protein
MRATIAALILLLVAGAALAQPADRPDLAHFIALSSKAEIYVADTLNWRVQKYVRK